MKFGLSTRGEALVAVAVGGFLLGHIFGGRSLNAIVMPAVALLAVGAVGVARADEPSAERRLASHGFLEATVRVELEVATTRPVTATVHDRLPEGLGGESTFETVADGRSHEYDLALDHRGIHEVGPVEVTVTDLFGLWERRFVVDVTDEVIVFPRVHGLYESTGLLSGYVGITDEREQFDSIREYQQGDALRDVNWKASAKRNGELVVTEYAGEGANNSVTVGVTRAPGPLTDAAAEAAASVAIHLLDAGLAVGLVTPSGSLNPATGSDHRRRLLTVLAEYSKFGAEVDADDADVLVRTTPGATDVQIEAPGGVHSFGTMVATEGENAATGEVAA